MSGYRHILTAGLYWLGVVMALTCIALMVLGHRISGAALETGRFPLTWWSAAAAVISFLAAELCHSTATGKTRTEAAGHPRPGSAAD